VNLMIPTDSLPRGHTRHHPRHNKIMRTIAVFTLVAFTSLIFQPLALAVNAPKRGAAAQALAKPETDDEKLSRTLDKIENKLSHLEDKLTKKQNARVEKDELKNLHQQLMVQDLKTMASFKKLELKLKAKNLPKVILDRHAKAVAQYQKNIQLLKNNLTTIETATNDDDRRLKVKKARDHLHKKQLRKSKSKFDPNDLPSGPAKLNKKNKPKLKKKHFRQAGLFNTPFVKLASHGSYRFDTLASASNPAYLAQSDEVLITPAIQAKADLLQHNPVTIYNWVRNNVAWIPAWGAVQDADVTLGSLRGNSLDVASLLIALYRASGIPTRYVHGAIDVSTQQFMNWTGGFSKPEAAMLFAAYGGVPITQVIRGGKIDRIQLEHVWVEAAIDFAPSRGGVNKSADTWVQLDASYKQYEDLTGLDVLTISGIDPNQLATDFTNSGTVNEAEGWVQNLDATVLQTAQTQAQTALTNYINTNLTNPVVGDVIGSRRIIASNTSILPASMPYKVIVKGARYAALPVLLQNTMTFSFGRDALGELINPVTLPYAKLNNHKATLSFKPATAADEAALLALLPRDPITDPSQLPSTIPAYLIYVIPEIAVSGQVVARGNSMQLGSELDFGYHIQRRGQPAVDNYNYSVTAGSYLNLAIISGSVSPTKLTELQTKLTATQTIMNSGDLTLISSLTREDILGDLFHAGGMGYWGQYLALSHLQGLSNQASFDLPNGYGSFGYEPNVTRLFGFPRTLKPGGIAVNVRVSWNYIPQDGDMTKWKGLNLQAGMLSSVLESAVPEQIFNTDPANPIDGISAIKALQLAAQQGQKIYHITQQNQATALPQLTLSSLAMKEIRQGLAAGKEVITHASQVSVPGFTGEGYIITDPVTGSGAYKITGGGNGSFKKIASIVPVNVTGILWDVMIKIAWHGIQYMARKNSPLTKLAGSYLSRLKKITSFTAKLPGIIADCVVAGAPAEFIQALVAVRTFWTMSNTLIGIQTVTFPIGIPILLETMGAIQDLIEKEALVAAGCNK